MNVRLRIPELPLLVKELNEQASQVRTYVIRVTYAAVLFIAACTVMYQQGSSTEVDSVGRLGSGRAIFEWLVTLQFWGIYLFLPALACSAISSEKERDSLSLLLLTTLSPWQIVIQKLLGRLVPMYTFLLLAMPLLSVSYSFGGVTNDQLWWAIIILVMTCLQVGALSLMWSAYFPTTAMAFMATYLSLLLVMILSPCCGFVVYGPSILDVSQSRLTAAAGMGCIVLAISTIVLLVFSRLFVVQRAFVLSRNPLLWLFRQLDDVFVQANTITGGIVLVNDHVALPGDYPVGWRETKKKTLGTARYLFRVLVVLETPLLVVISFIVNPISNAGVSTVSKLLFVIWVVSVGLVAVQAGSVIVSERVHQTLDVLLTSPMSGRDIVLQKFHGVRRLLLVISIPFLSVYLFEGWWSSEFGLEYVFWSLLTLIILLPLVAWTAIWVSLKFRSQIRALFATLGIVTVWTALVPLVLYILESIVQMTIPELVGLVKMLSPAELIYAVETTDIARLKEPIPLRISFAVSFLLHGGLLYLIRRHCLDHADALLGRVSIESPAVRDEEFALAT